MRMENLWKRIEDCIKGMMIEVREALSNSNNSEKLMLDSELNIAAKIGRRKQWETYLGIKTLWHCDHFGGVGDDY